MLVIDMMSVRAHVNLNSFYLHELSSWKPVLYISAELEDSYKNISARRFGERPCSSGIFDRLMAGLRVISILLRQRPRQVVFFSYDLLTFPVISHFAAFLGIKVLCFEHNTAPRTRSRRFLHHAMSSGVKRLVYGAHIMPLYTDAGIEAIYVPHPCVRPKESTGDDSEWREIVADHGQHSKNVAFCPSGSVTLELIEKVAVQHADTLFVCKSTRSSSVKNVKCRKYFEAYSDALAGCDFVCVLFPLEHKVSGPVFEAIAMGKPVMVLENAFGQYMKSLFPGAIFYSSEDIPREVVVSVDEYNRSIICKIAEGLTSTLGTLGSEGR